MDSVSQIVLGASIAGVCAPTGHRGKAMLLGAALGTLPDLDVLIDYGDPVSNMTYHRGFSHSLLVLAPFSVLLWLVLKRFWGPVRESPRRWLVGIGLALVTHPLLDAHTIYGTQLWWPFEPPPTMWSTLFIIDPIYTLPMLVAVLWVAFRPASRRTPTLLAVGLALSQLYLGWTWIAKLEVSRLVQNALAMEGLTDANYVTAATPFNSLLWRVIVMTDDGYLQGFHSLVADDGAIRLKKFGSATDDLNDAMPVWAVHRLDWFSHGFQKAEVQGEALVLRDLRMGLEPDYIFSHRVAIRNGDSWEAIEPQYLPVRFDRAGIRRVWQRIWDSEIAL